MKPVFIQYYDHLEFRNMNMRKYEDSHPLLRELLGWLVEETDEYIIVLSEKAVSDNPEEVARLKPSGFVILKSTIKNMVDIGE